MPVTDPGFTIAEFLGLLGASVIGGFLTGGLLIRVYLWCTRGKGYDDHDEWRRRLTRRMDDYDDDGDRSRRIVVPRQSASTLPIQNPPPEDARLSGTVRGEKAPVMFYSDRLHINQNAEFPPKFEYLPPIDLGSTFVAEELGEAPAGKMQVASHPPRISGNPRYVRSAPFSQGESREERRARAFPGGLEASTWSSRTTNDAVSPLPPYSDTAAALRPPHYTRGPIYPGPFPPAGIGAGNPWY